MHYKEYKTILSAKNGMNIYRGCTHGCIYCDSRSTCYQMDHDFDDVEVKKDAPNILIKQLKSKTKKSMIFTGSMSDPYIPLEHELKYTRNALQAIYDNGFGASILTKSNLILRDLDLIKAINTETKAVVNITLTTFSEDLCKILEPNVSTTKERFEVLKIMNQNNIPTVVWFGPVLPFINDDLENLIGILDYCLQANVKKIMFMGFGITLREGNREYYYQKLDQHFPGLKEKYIKTYGNSYVTGSKNYQQLTKYFKSFCQKHNIQYGSNNIFDYLYEFPEKNQQLTLF